MVIITMIIAMMKTIMIQKVMIVILAIMIILKDLVMITVTEVMTNILLIQAFSKLVFIIMRKWRRCSVHFSGHCSTYFK